jgi:hypothetical protein
VSNAFTLGGIGSPSRLPQTPGHDQLPGPHRRHRVRGREGEWAVAFHTLEALADGVEPSVVEALRRGELPDDPRMAALSPGRASTAGDVDRAAALIAAAANS